MPRRRWPQKSQACLHCVERPFGECFFFPFALGGIIFSWGATVFVLIIIRNHHTMIPWHILLGVYVNVNTYTYVYLETSQQPINYIDLDQCRGANQEAMAGSQHHYQGYFPQQGRQEWGQVRPSPGWGLHPLGGDAPTKGVSIRRGWRVQGVCGAFLQDEGRPGCCWFCQENHSSRPGLSVIVCNMHFHCLFL